MFPGPSDTQSPRGISGGITQASGDLGAAANYRGRFPRGGKRLFFFYLHVRLGPYAT